MLQLIINITSAEVVSIYNNLIFNGCLRLRFLDVETNPGLRIMYLLSAEYTVVMFGAWPEP